QKQQRKVPRKGPRRDTSRTVEETARPPTVRRRKYCSRSRSTDRTVGSGHFPQVSKKYLPPYVDEFQFRYNNRENAGILGTTIGRMLNKSQIALGFLLASALWAVYFVLQSNASPYYEICKTNEYTDKESCTPHHVPYVVV